MNQKRLFNLFSAAALVLLLSGCASVQYSALEKVGIHKRDILVDRIKDAQDAQREVKQEVISAYEQFTSLVEVDGGRLEQTYKNLSRRVRSAEESAAEVDDRIQSIERVAEDLFEEWKSELSEYNSESLRRASQRKMDKTHQHYLEMLGSMQQARTRIDPVLGVFQDQVLFLKHNLNARALSSLKGEVVGIEQKVNVLIRDMETAIAEADQFIQSMNRP